MTSRERHEQASIVLRQTKKTIPFNSNLSILLEEDVLWEYEKTFIHTVYVLLKLYLKTVLPWYWKQLRETVILEFPVQFAGSYFMGRAASPLTISVFITSILLMFFNRL